MTEPEHQPGTNLPVATPSGESVPAVTPASAPPAARPPAVRQLINLRGMQPMIFLVALFSLALWWLNQSRIDTVERELARRVQDGDSVSRESQMLAKQAQDQVIALQTRLGVLETRVAESQSQQLALEQLYQELSRSRDDWALAEVEQVLAVASQQLQLAGNVQGAIIALQNADNRLARSDKPQFISLRRVLARDLDRLKTLPSVDLAGNALRIDTLVGMVDTLPLLADEKPAAPPRLDAAPVERKPKPASGKAGKGDKNADKAAKDNGPSWVDSSTDAFRYAGAEVVQQFRQLVRVREVETPDALLLTPSQAYFVRENLKLRLLNARLALLARQESIYRSDLLRSQEVLQQYFDVHAKQSVTAIGILKQIQASNTVVELPTLAESLTAVRNFKGPR